MKKIVALACLMIGGCVSSTGVIQTAPDVFMVSKRSNQAGLGAPVGARADVYREAGEFCAKRGQQIQEVAYDEQSSAFARPGSAQLRFTCVPKS